MKLKITAAICIICFNLTAFVYAADLQTQIAQIVNGEITDGNIPGAVIYAGQNDKELFFGSFGNMVTVPHTEPMQKDTIFDIASLSKPVSTAVCVLILIDRDKISLDDYASKFIPAFVGCGKEKIQIKHLLSHTSGLPGYTSAEPIQKKHGSPCPDKVIEKICSLKTQSAPGEKSCYSCLGYITLGKIVEKVSGQTLDVFAKENIFEPLSMHDTYYNPPAEMKARIAAAELKDGKLNRGVVHDPLAELMGGVSGNAGVFTTASDLTIYCRMILNDGKANGKQILSSQSISLLTTGKYFGRAFGFDVNSSNHSWIKGKCFGAKTFCHSGYTGTSIVCDTESKKFVIILTNRVHPNDKGSVSQLRIQIADAVCNYSINH
ncbi:MAG: beta-lactamase family protein [Planctomycetaceae bacterium]|nr:beta-lactamase family protein [Planctomycetaceae bacterium]